MPPRKPEPSEMIDAAILSTKSSATVHSDSRSIPAKCSAPWPDDITCGATIANSPTRNPADRRSQRQPHLTRTNKASHSATPRISRMPARSAKQTDQWRR